VAAPLALLLVSSTIIGMGDGGGLPDRAIRMSSNSRNEEPLGAWKAGASKADENHGALHSQAYDAGSAHAAVSSPTERRPARTSRWDVRPHPTSPFCLPDGTRQVVGDLDCSHDHHDGAADLLTIHDQSRARLAPRGGSESGPATWRTAHRIISYVRVNGQNGHAADFVNTAAPVLPLPPLPTAPALTRWSIEDVRGGRERGGGSSVNEGDIRRGRIDRRSQSQSLSKQSLISRPVPPECVRIPDDTLPGWLPVGRNRWSGTCMRCKKKTVLSFRPLTHRGAPLCKGCLGGWKLDKRGRHSSRPN
jgi:hypothetical protein